MVVVLFLSQRRRDGTALEPPYRVDGGQHPHDYRLREDWPVQLQFNRLFDDQIRNDQ